MLKGAFMNKYKYQSNNLDWGFFGTLIDNYHVSDEQAKHMFDYACRYLKCKGVEHWQFCMDGEVRKSPIEFLDSRTGRKIVDAMTFELAPNQEISLPKLEKAFRKTMDIKWSKYA